MSGPKLSIGPRDLWQYEDRLPMYINSQYRSWDHLNFIMEIPILVRQYLIIKALPWSCWTFEMTKRDGGTSVTNYVTPLQSGAELLSNTFRWFLHLIFDIFFVINFIDQINITKYIRISSHKISEQLVSHDVTSMHNFHIKYDIFSHQAIEYVLWG